MVKGMNGFTSMPGGTNFFSAYTLESTSLD